ncbi:interferon a3-like isoform X2 [Oncorhynchus keta]|uniref:interferon a3-like isoform X1 n=1 Tax=Oncorhynchus keta TaxID=8018 RepID=UPI00227C5665|nr:interferon a3-like isoform X1 [Oncorhynchus keta]XP_052374557.1 interferon a3-like isoform X2 [Oncorhynchus keta]
MGSISFWMCLVMTICTWNKTIGCTWMKTLPRSPSMFQVFSNNTITMLKKMGHEVSRGPQITFPDKQYRQVNNFKADEQIAFISHTLNAINKLYSSGKYESPAWDQKGVDKFMNDLYRQTSELDQCVKAMKTRLSKSVNRVNKKMSLHFKFLKHYLKREDYSASGWEDIRTVVLAHLQRLDTTLSSQ